MKSFRFGRRALTPLFVAFAVWLGGGTSALFGDCGPFTDVTTFCSNVLEVFYLGITTGTTATTYDPTSNVSRLQMAIFLSRSADRLLQRGSRRAALKVFWTPQNDAVLGKTLIGGTPTLVESDGADLWVSNFGGTVSRVRGSDGKLLETWTGAANAAGVAIVTGHVIVTGFATPGKLYQIDPTQSAGAVTTVATNLGSGPWGAAFDGSRIWTANFGGSVSIATPAAAPPWSVSTITTGFSKLRGVLYDGANVWATDEMAGTLLKLDGAGAILQTVTVGSSPWIPVFDGTNIWVPNRASSSVSIVRASGGALLATLTGNGLAAPEVAAFDGQRILVTNNAGDSVSLWKAADLTPLGSFGAGQFSGPEGACSDGVNFWVTQSNVGSRLVRF